MSLFRNLGKRVERIKRQVEDAAAEEATHVCTSCEERFYMAYDTCPECGADAIEAIE